MSDSLWPHGLQHARHPCPSPSPALITISHLSSPWVYSNSCPLSQWCNPTISFSVIPFSFCPQSFPVSGSFQMSQALCIRWPKYWSFSFNISPSNEYLGLISFRLDWLDLLAVQGTLKCLLQHHNSKASILRHSAFFIVQLSHPYMTTGKTIALTRRTFVGKVMSPVAAVTNNHKLHGLKHQKCYSLTVLEARSTGSLSLHWNQGVGRVTCPLDTLGDNAFLFFFFKAYFQILFHYQILLLFMESVLSS